MTLVYRGVVEIASCPTYPIVHPVSLSSGGMAYVRCHLTASGFEHGLSTENPATIIAGTYQIKSPLFLKEGFSF